MFGPDPDDGGDSTRDSALRLTAKARLLAMHVPPFAITRWCDAWEAEASAQGREPSAGYWDDGVVWILQQVAHGNEPPTSD